ncbi:Cof-type HAD-IIB family hydrolase [Alkaliphilus serpentinus]|uniref:HAD family phosphatase n=1 Tax=Alkaliphilus serpentinus TaxID=1482731 RepID=A0A833M994_9FIRM|nr:Cof-type HAD-IIB family hydrolase [Alkaliphilus serpentinus]KAB3529260.1 HAD family phosphatase [Alkaliphilus serpentinus]
MEYKILATDMDGTLLKNDKSLSSKNIQALRRAHQMGMEIVISTGRPYATLKPYLKIIGIDCWLITNNGSVIRNKKDEIVDVIYIDHSTLLTVIKLLENEGIYFHGTDPHYTFIRSYRERLRVFRGYLKYKNLNPMAEGLQLLWSVLLNGTHKRIDFKNYINKLGKISSLFIHSNDIQRLEDLKNQLKVIAEVEITSSGRENIEVLNRLATKGNGLRKVCEILKIPASDVVAVGDNINDISMIQYAGLGVAMGNAEEIVKEIADCVTTTNEEDGISHLIDKLLSTNGVHENKKIRV